MEQTEIDLITEKLKVEDLSPPDLAAIYTQLAGWYSYYGQQMKRVKLEKPAIWLGIKQLPVEFVEVGENPAGTQGRPRSDKHTETLWEASEEGQQELELEWTLKAIEKMMSSIKARLYVDNQAAKNTY